MSPDPFFPRPNVKRKKSGLACETTTTQLEEEPNLDNEFESHNDVLDDGAAAIQSTYERRKEKLGDHWGELRASLIRIKISTHGYPPIGANCICCGLSNAMIRCNDCGPNVFYCSECAISNHTNVNVMHRLFTWKVIIYAHLSITYMARKFLREIPINPH